MDRNLKNLLSGSDALFLLDLIHESLSCTQEEDIKSLITRFQRLISCERAVSVFAEKKGDGAIEAFTALNINYSPGYVEEFVKGGFTEKDPVFVENFKNPRLQYWADTNKQYPIPKSLIALAEDFGFDKVAKGYGYAHGIRNPKDTEISLFSFYGVKRNKRAEVILEIMIPHLHETLARFINLTRNTLQLSPKETEVLKWMSEGKSAWVVSQILKVSENTVNFHIKNIKNKLDASNIVHAVAIALRARLI